MISHKWFFTFVLFTSTIIVSVSALSSPRSTTSSPSWSVSRDSVGFGIARSRTPSRFGIVAVPSKTSPLHMSDDGGDGGGTARQRKKKKGVSVTTKERVDTQLKEDKKDDTLWRVLLHNDEVHTFNYVVQSLIKVIGTLDRKTSYEICVVTHSTGVATVTTTWKKQAEKFCMSLQRQGLTASIAPDSKYKPRFSDTRG